MIKSNSSTITHLKKQLATLISQNNYDLLSPEVISLSEEIDRLMVPIFKTQLTKTIDLKERI